LQRKKKKVIAIEQYQTEKKGGNQVSNQISSKIFRRALSKER